MWGITRKGATYLGLSALLLPTGVALAQGPFDAGGMPEDLKKELVSGGNIKVPQPTRNAEDIIDGQTLRLADGRVLRLASVLAPLKPLDIPDRQPWPTADAARQGLRAMLGSADVSMSLYYDRERSDRYGRIVAHAETSDEIGGTIWMQQALLENGWARVRTTPRNFAGAAQLYAAEDAARRARRGLWAEPHYRVRCAARHRDIDEGFQIVVGRVIDVATVRNITYLNFGANWRGDFTVRIKGAARRAVGFEEPPQHLIGEILEVRGTVFEENGPMIDLDHRAALRLADEFASDEVNKKGCPSPR